MAGVVRAYPSKEHPFLERISVGVLKFGHEGHTCLWVKLSSKNGRCCQESDQRIFAVARLENSRSTGVVLAGHVILPTLIQMLKRRVVGALPDLTRIETTE